MDPGNELLSLGIFSFSLVLDFVFFCVSFSFSRFSHGLAKMTGTAKLISSSQLVLVKGETPLSG